MGKASKQLRTLRRLPFVVAACASELIRPKFAIPIHYGTFLVLKGTPQEYTQTLGSTSVKVFPINPGDKLTFP